MTTKFIPTRYLFYGIVVAILISSCSGNGAKQTQEAIYGAAEAAQILGDMTAEEAAVSLVAIQAVLGSSAQKAGMEYMLWNELHGIAVFVSRGAQAPTGGYYAIVGAVDTIHGTILRTADVYNRFNINMSTVKSFQDLRDALDCRGFREIAPAAFPSLWSALRLGIGYLRTLGNSVSHVLVVPAVMLSPEYSPLLDGQEWLER